MCTQCMAKNVIKNSNNNILNGSFSDKIIKILNSGAATLMISIGHRTGLFDTMVNLSPSRSSEIAKNSNLNERYVKEWLGAMVTSQIVNYNVEDDTYHLPEEHAQYLTRVNPSENIALLSQYFAMLGCVEDQIVDCFVNGGGIPYSAYPRFQSIMAEDSQQSVVSMILDHVLPMIPGMIERLEMGIDVLDVGCGQGKALNLMAERFPKSRFTGFDISLEAIEAGTMESKTKGCNNIKFVLKDAANFNDKNAFDLITTFDSIHDQAKPDHVLKNIYYALRHNGVYLMQDINMHSNVGENREHPIGTLIYTISCMHCMTVSLAEGGVGLGAAWGVELALEMLKGTGFQEIEIKSLSHDIQNCYYIVRK